MKYYIAYGSNLSVEQMAYRCPGAEIAGKAMLEGWALAFGAHATIEPRCGASVPVLIWKISEEDEKSLDRYEGYPTYYYKEDLVVEMTDFDGANSATVTAMVYIMTERRRDGTPTLTYVRTIAEGYDRFGFDLDILLAALSESVY